MPKPGKTSAKPSSRGAKKDASATSRSAKSGSASGTRRSAASGRSGASAVGRSGSGGAVGFRGKAAQKLVVTKGATTAGSEKTLKSYRLTQSKIDRAREILGASNATAAIETALDLVVFRNEVLRGAAALRGMRFAPFDDEAAPDAATATRE